MGKEKKKVLFFHVMCIFCFHTVIHATIKRRANGTNVIFAMKTKISFLLRHFQMWTNGPAMWFDEKNEKRTTKSCVK